MVRTPSSTPEPDPEAAVEDAAEAAVEAAAEAADEAAAEAEPEEDAAEEDAAVLPHAVSARIMAADRTADKICFFINVSPFFCAALDLSTKKTARRRSLDAGFPSSFDSTPHGIM
jgi:hypothetical protein